MSTAIALDHVALRFAGGTVALNDLSLALEAGSFTALVGPSGCGKSSVLRVIAGLLAPSAGTVSRPAGRVGFVFQEPTLLAWRSVYDNVALPLRLQKLAEPTRAARVQEALHLVGLTARAGALPRQLSGGMKMRVSLARALAQQPEILLMDEPFGALDELTRNRLDDDLLGIWQARRPTVLFVTHSMSEAAYLAERVVVMRGDGQLGDDIAVARPEAMSGFRASPAYQTAYQAVAAALGHELNDAPAQKGDTP